MIFSADLHITKDVPKARIDDFLAAQDAKLRFILDLAKKSPPWFISGDLFDKARPGDWIEKYIIDMFNWFQVKPIVIAGQHDLPWHSHKLLDDCGLGVLEAAGVIHLMRPNDEEGASPYWYNDEIIACGIPWDYEVTDPSNLRFHKDDTRLKVLLWHHMVIDSPLWSGQIADSAGKILRLFPQFDIIITGDNHKTFTARSGNRILINPGSMMRTNADQIIHRPCVFRYERDGEIEQVFLPIESADKVLSREHIEQKKAKDERISQVVEMLKSDYKVGLSFKRNLEQTLLLNSVEPEVVTLIRQVVGRVTGGESTGKGGQREM